MSDDDKLYITDPERVRVVWCGVDLLMGEAIAPTMHEMSSDLACDFVTNFFMYVPSPYILFC